MRKIQNKNKKKKKLEFQNSSGTALRPNGNLLFRSNVPCTVKITTHKTVDSRYYKK